MELYRCCFHLGRNRFHAIGNRSLRIVQRRSYQATMTRPSSLPPDSSQPSLVIFDSLTESFQPVPTTTDNGKGIAWYTCGPTTYAPAHLGHARTYICLDILRRVMESQHKYKQQPHPPPLFVMNITNVDDKIIAASKEEGVPPIELAQRYEDDFWKDWDALGCLRPHVVMRVTDHVESDILPYIERLVRLGMAYAVENDGVYFDIKAYESKMGHLTKYGKLAPPSAATDFFSTSTKNNNEDSGDQSGINHDNNMTKNDARDFVLWKNRKPGESLFWPSPWGEGRPGWHIECSAMIESARKKFQDTHDFHVHAGGIDLKFPHHANEIAQAEAYHYKNAVTETTTTTIKKEWIPHWVHTGHLHISGMKMSKSLKNFITIEEMLLSDGPSSSRPSSLSSPADDFRLWCLGLSGSYRGPATYSKDRLTEAKILREKIVRFLLDAQEWMIGVERSNVATSKQWTDTDVGFFQIVIQASNICTSAMTGQYTASSKQGQPCGLGGSDFDMNGSIFLEQIMVIAEAGSAHLKATTSNNAPTIEPVRFAVDAMRDHLSLIGFSDATVRAGMDLSSSLLNEDNRSNILGGERTLLEEFVGFRSSIRKAALSDVGDKTATANMKKILKACDNLRDDRFPRIGLQILDDSANGDNNENDSSLGWKYRVPRTNTIEHNAKKHASIVSLENIDSKDLFRTGQYVGKFLEYDDQGIPTVNADGSELSKRLLKKLVKKRDNHIKRRKASDSNSLVS